MESKIELLQDCWFDELYEHNEALLEKEYREYCDYIIQTDYETRVYEGLIPSGLKNKLAFIKELAANLKYRLKDLFKLFMNKKVFKLFSFLNWDMKKLVSVMRDGYKNYKNFRDAVKQYIENTKVIKWTQEQLLKLDEFLKKHPKTKRIVGVALAGMLLYMWLTMTFVGDPTYDFDISDMFDALKGKASFASIFGGTSGAAFLTLFATGAIFKLSFPWPGTSAIKLTAAVLMTLAKKLKIKLQKGEEEATYKATSS